MSSTPMAMTVRTAARNSLMKSPPLAGNRPSAVPTRSAIFSEAFRPVYTVAWPQKESAVFHPGRMSAMGARILIVEDDPDIADLITRFLDKAGFTTERAGSGRDALKQITARPPDLVVLDLMLPHMDGLEICRILRSDERTAA